MSVVRSKVHAKILEDAEVENKWVKREAERRRREDLLPPSNYVKDLLPISKQEDDAFYRSHFTPPQTQQRGGNFAALVIVFILMFGCLALVAPYIQKLP